MSAPPPTHNPAVESIPPLFPHLHQPTTRRKIPRTNPQSKQTFQNLSRPHSAGSLQSTQKKMVFVKYDTQIKALVVRMLVEGCTPAHITGIVGFTIHKRTMARWCSLFETTQSVVRDLATYSDRGRPLALNSEEREFLLDVLEHEPTLYLDEIQAHLKAMTGIRHPIATIHADLRSRLQLSRKVARTVHPGQSAVRRANYICEIAQIPSEYLVFTDEAGVSHDTHRHTMGWARQRRRSHHIHRTHDALRINVLPAVSLDGILCSIAQAGVVHGIVKNKKI
ncbi:hypothetical protein MJO29_010874 [Puccinia striiformis f. sp. tritici]|nr:hypothetical protein MJO29_010874 [Puccinia striiformis f. sp. tritici]